MSEPLKPAIRQPVPVAQPNPVAPTPRDTLPGATTRAAPNGTASARRTGASQANLTPAASDGQANASDGFFFENLMVMGVGERQSDNQTPHDGSPGASLSAPAMAQLVEELSTHWLAQTGENISVTLFMPKLGKILLKAQQRPGYLELELGFAEPDALQRVQNTHADCEDAMSQACGIPVELVLRSL